MSWNELYTKRRQKEMAKRSIEYNTKMLRKKGPFHSVYEDVYERGGCLDRRKKDKRRDKITWMIGYIVITLLTIVFVCCLVWIV